MSGKSRFFWHDLMTLDVERAKSFYGELFNWKFKTGTGDPYVHVMAGDKGIGGMMQVDRTQQTPPHWVGYVSIDDIDATVAAITQRGGKVLMPRTDVPEVGPFAIVADPQGAVFAPMHYIGKDAHHPESMDVPGPGMFCWDELATSDPAAAATFYGEIFGWTANAMEMPGFGTYTLLKRPGTKNLLGNERDAGGIMKLPPGVPHPFWLSYIAVADCDATVAAALRLGGTAASPAMDIPNVGRVAALFDPHHAAFAVIAPPSK